MVAKWCSSRYRKVVPDLLTVISFGRVVWMVEKAGAETSSILPRSPTIRNCVMLQCALNIACWWLVEYNKWVRGNNRVSFPGEVVMLRGLMPVAMWLGVREYGGVWRHGGDEGHYVDTE